LKPGFTGTVNLLFVQCTSQLVIGICANDNDDGNIFEKMEPKGFVRRHLTLEI